MPAPVRPADITPRCLAVIHSADLTTPNGGGLVPSTRSNALMKRTGPHPKKCRCVLCRRQRSRRRAAKARQVHQADYIEATIISVTSADEGAGDWQGYSSSPPSGYGAPAQGAIALSLWRQLWTRKRYPFLATTVLLSLLLLVLVAYTGPVSWFVAALNPPSATITIMAKRVEESRTVSVTAVTGRPGVNQVAARLIRASTSLTVGAKATGSGQAPALASRGTLTFYNEGSSSQTVEAGTVLRGSDGIQVETSAAATVPAGNPPNVGIAAIGAHAVEAGGQSNIGALDVNGLCCAAGLAVKNTAPFSGGQDAQSWSVLEQRDIDEAAGSVEPLLVNRAGEALKAQVSSSELLAHPPLCRTAVKPADAAGSKITQTNVNVAVICTGETYDSRGAQHAAATRFAQQVVVQLGTSYKLISPITTAPPQVSVADTGRGTLTLLVQAGATWSYQFTKHEQQELARHIEGEPIARALAFIAGAPGVEHCSIQLSGEGQTIPSDRSHIAIVVLPARGRAEAVSHAEG